MDTSKLMIDARDLQRNFGVKEAVAGISFQAYKGEIFGLLGPNGAGKTTTIRMLTGQIDPSDGSARVAGCDVVAGRALLKQRIGVVFEEQNLYERLSARLNLEFSCWLYKLPESRIDEVLELVHLRDRARDPVRTFSNGMKQRLLIARALLHRPPMLFLDEPSRGLDPISAREVRQVVRQLSQEGTTILLTTHLMEEADLLCQHVAFIVDGRIVANDTPRNLKLSHGQRALLVTLEQTPPGGNGASPIQEMSLSLDDPADQTRLAQWMAQGKVRAVHSSASRWVCLLAAWCRPPARLARSPARFRSFTYCRPFSSAHLRNCWAAAQSHRLSRYCRHITLLMELLMPYSARVISDNWRSTRGLLLLR